MIFLTQEIQGGYTWTITSKLGHILRTAEEKYGNRDKEYTILGVEVSQNEQPQIWYPGNCKHIAIQLTQGCIVNMNRAVFQLAHEAIHCLSPTGGQNANYLEEGLATHFSIEYTFSNGHGTWTAERPKYVDALSKVRELLKIDSDIIKKVRVIQPTISLITVDNLLATNDKIPEKLAVELVMKF